MKNSPHVVIFGILFRDRMKIIRVDAGDDMLCVVLCIYLSCPNNLLHAWCELFTPDFMTGT